GALKRSSSSPTKKLAVLNTTSPLTEDTTPRCCLLCTKCPPPSRVSLVAASRRPTAASGIGNVQPIATIKTVKAATTPTPRRINKRAKKPPKCAWTISPVSLQREAFVAT
ncbi:unnamed protein product, partial [Ectocarpus sp. 6 AP-2014]